MNLPDIAVRRPVAVVMAVLVVSVFGVVALRATNIAVIPDISFPVVTVVTVYPGAAPEEVETYVSKVIEDGVGSAKSVKTIYSNSRENMSMVTLEFEWGTDVDMAAVDVREKVDAVVEQLPKGAYRPVVSKFDPTTAMPVVTVGVAGLQDPVRLRKLASDVVKRELERLDGVAAVTVIGGLERDILVEIDREQLEARGLTVEQVQRALASENLNIRCGRFDEGRQEFSARVIGEFHNLDEIGEIAVGAPGGIPVLLRDVAQVRDWHKDRRNYARVDGSDAVVLLVSKRSRANTVAVAEAVRKALPSVQRLMPNGCQLTGLWGQDSFVRSAIQGLKSETLEAGLLAVLVVFLFLASLRSTVIVAVSIPLSLLATLLCMSRWDMTLNMVTLGGLTLAVGRIIDDSIVVVEAVHRHLAEGKPIQRAAIDGTHEVGLAITASTLTTVGAFLPLLYCGGMGQQFLGPMAVTVALALMASLLVALTVAPLLASRVLRPEGEAAGILAQLARRIERLQVAADERYRRAVRLTTRHRGVTAVCALLLFAASLGLVPVVGFEFFPRLSRDDVICSLETAEGSSVHETNRLIRRAEGDELKVLDREYLISIAGSPFGEEAAAASGSAAAMGVGLDTNKGLMLMELVDRRRRQRTPEQIEDHLRERFREIPGLTPRFVDLTSVLFGGRKDFEVKVYGPDLPVLRRLGSEIFGAVQDVPDLQGLDLSYRAGRPEYHILIDRAKAGRLGLSAGQVAMTLRAYVRGEDVTKYREAGDEYDLTVRLPENERDWVEKLQRVRFMTSLGSSVPFASVADVVPARGPVSITREGRQRKVTIDANVAGGRPLSEVLRDVDKRLTRVHFPEGYQYEYGGAEKDRREVFSGLSVALAAGVLLMYVVLSVQFASPVQPLVILSAVPLEVIGAFGMLLLVGRPLGVVGLLGVLMLTGIVVSNSILLVDYTNTLRRRGMNRAEALVEAGAVRLRPVLMTAIATVCAMVPVALGLREGGELLQPLAFVVIGGLAGSTLLTLLVVPPLYSLADDVSQAFRLRPVELGDGFDTTAEASRE